MVYDPESRWSICWQRHHQDFDYLKFFNHYYLSLAATNLGIDILSASSIVSSSLLSKYKVIVIPALLIVPEVLETHLRDYVKRGGHLVLTLRTGMKDRFNALLPARQPGRLAKLAGVEVEEYYALDMPVPVRGNWFEGSSEVWAERLKLLGDSSTQIIACYGKSNGWLDDQPAITVNSNGKGLVYFNGAYLDSVSQGRFIERVIKNANLKPAAAPAGVEIAARVTPDGKEITIAINHTQETKVLSCSRPVFDLLAKKLVSEKLELPPYGIAVLTRLE